MSETTTQNRSTPKKYRQPPNPQKARKKKQRSEKKLNSGRQKKDKKGQKKLYTFLQSELIIPEFKEVISLFLLKKRIKVKSPMKQKLKFLDELDHFLAVNATETKLQRKDRKEQRVWLKNEYDYLKEKLAVRLQRAA